MLKPLAIVLAAFGLAVLSACSSVTAAPDAPPVTVLAPSTTLPTRVILQTDAASPAPRQETSPVNTPLASEGGLVAIVWDQPYPTIPN